MNAVFVSHLASSLGSVTQTVETADKRQQLVSPAAALREAGFESHHVCPAGECSYQLAARALEESRIDTSSIDVIIYSTCLPLNGNVGDVARFTETRDVKHLMHFPASELQAEFDMRNAIVLGLNQQACTGMLGSLRIARSMLIAEPELLILDELSSGLDPLGRHDLRNVMLELKQQGRTIFFSSHELNEVESLCDRIVMIHRGLVVRSGPLADLQEEAGGSLEDYFIALVRESEAA